LTAPKSEVSSEFSVETIVESIAARRARPHARPIGLSPAKVRIDNANEGCEYLSGLQMALCHLNNIFSTEQGGGSL
jgi:hypothetical protein